MSKDEKTQRCLCEEGQPSRCEVHAEERKRAIREIGREHPAPVSKEKLGTCDTSRLTSDGAQRVLHNGIHCRLVSCVNWREQPAPGESRTCEHCGGRVFIESTHGPGKCVPAHPHTDAQPSAGEKPLPTIPNLLCNLAQILDVVKGEWGESWSEWDQQQRDAITGWQRKLDGSRKFEWVPEPSAQEGGAREFWASSMRWTEPLGLDDLCEFAEAYAEQKVRGLRQERDALSQKVSRQALTIENRQTEWRKEREARERAEGALRDLPKKIEAVLLKRIKIVGDEDHAYYGYPQQLIDELVAALKSSQEEGKL